MAYSDFTLESAIRRFALTLHAPVDLFAAVAPVLLRKSFDELLREQIPVATAVHTEKARSELIVVPILMEARRQSRSPTSFFSGVSFDVSPELGLNGVCDYLISRSPNQFIVGPPVLAVVEAKNDSIRGGLGQCVAEMVAARLFNKYEPLDSSPDPTGVIHGAVTTGSLWRFLRLRGTELQIDKVEYTLDHVEKILAVLIACLASTIAPISGDGTPAETGLTPSTPPKGS